MGLTFRPSWGLTILSVLLCSLTASPLEAAKRRSRPAVKAKKLTPVEVMIGQIFLNSYTEDDSLAEACARSNFSYLAVGLDMNADWMEVPKGEFETQQEFDKRDSKLAALMAERSVIVCEPVFNNPDVQLTYDADRERFSGSFMREHNVWRDVKQLGSYRSKTRMGVAATVRRSLEMNYDISLKLPEGLKGCLAGNYSSFSFSAAVPRAEAPGVKRAGRLIIIGKLVSPYSRKVDEEGDPTLDDPYDVFTRTITVSVRPERVILLGPDGATVWSCKPGRYLPAAAPQPIGKISDWIGSNDYPYRASKEHRTGSVGVRLTIGVDGGAIACEVSSSSGSSDLDETTCITLRRRAKFTPAANDDGDPIESTFQTTVNWSLPE